MLKSYADLAVRSIADLPHIRNLSEAKVSIGDV
jgi:hypothetical protein